MRNVKICLVAFMLVAAMQSFVRAEVAMPKVSGYVQTEYQGLQGGVDQFKVRRARLKIAGDVDPMVSYTILTDAVAATNLAAAYFDIKSIEGITLRAGQFKTPFSRAYLTSSTKHDTVDISSAINSLTSKYDTGIQVMGSVEMIKYSVGIFNGSGLNTADTNDNKDVIGRIDVPNVLPGLEVGFAGLYGKDASTGNNKKGVGTNVKYRKDALEVKAEAMSVSNSTVNGQGGFLQVGYDLSDKCQAVAMYDMYDPNIRVSGDKTNILTLGLNRFMSKNTKLQVNYLLISEETTAVDNDQLLVQMQVVF
jgi:phosphate-selective porin